MAEPTSGLRFDIYEKIELPQEMEGIGQLDEIELIPQIELTTNDEQVALKGNLLLTGKYNTGNDQRSSQKLQHLIPVEITLPVDRIQDINNIGIDIDNFDVDLLSSRNLSVTGVLSLKGIQVNSSEEREWNEEEDVVFVHRANENHSSEGMELEESRAPEFPEVTDDLEKAEESETMKELETEIEIEKDKELVKIAFNEKENSTEDESGETRQSHLGTEWKSLFLSQEGEEPQQFSKMRMCIVQKEETLESIAERYSLNPREISLYNRLGDQVVEEGQIIYIPN